MRTRQEPLSPSETQKRQGVTRRAQALVVTALPSNGLAGSGISGITNGCVHHLLNVARTRLCCVGLAGTGRSHEVDSSKACIGIRDDNNGVIPAHVYKTF